MNTMRRKPLAVAGLLMAAIAVASRSANAADRRPLNRSVYVPITFSVCPHLTEALLYVEDHVAGLLPGERIFQFTYYPELNRVEPQVIQLLVKGKKVEGDAPFLGRLALTPGGIHTAREHLPFDLSRQIGELRYKVDVRHQKISLVVRCQEQCAAKSLVAANDQDAPLPPASHP